MLIGISGKIASGKDTVADIIVANFRSIGGDGNRPAGKWEKWEIRRFAARLKETVAVLTRTSLADNYTRGGKQKIPAGFSDSLGVLQQKVGTALREHISDNVWIHTTLCDFFDAIPEDQESRPNVIVTDVRFHNEAEAILKLGGVLIRVNGDPTGCRKFDSRDLEHPSETQLDDYTGFTWVLENDGTLEELAKSVKSVAELIIKQKFIV